jgi:hypothetical protein
MSGTPVGAVGTVSTRVRGGAAPGEVVVLVQGTRETWIAYGDEALDVGVPVLVVGVRPGRCVDVVRWEIAGQSAAPRWADPSSTNEIQG